LLNRRPRIAKEGNDDLRGDLNVTRWHREIHIDIFIVVSIVVVFHGLVIVETLVFFRLTPLHFYLLLST